MTKKELQKIADTLAEKLDTMPDGLEISSAQLLMDNGYDIKDFEMMDLFEYHNCLFSAAKKKHIVLDMSKHDGLIEGLPFNLDFVVRHRES